MGLNKKELATIAATNRDNYALTIQAAEGGLWKAIVTIKQPSASYDISTSRGDIKTWKHLDDALLFLQEPCTDCRTVTVIIGTWTLVRELPQNMPDR